MTTDEYITHLRRKGIMVSVQEDKVEIKAPDGALTSDIIEDLKSKKRDILDFFNSIIQEKEFELIKPAPIQPHYPLSRGQIRLWILNELGETQGLYNSPLIFPIGDLDTAIIEDTLHELISRHEILRTVIKIVEGQPRQFVKEIEDFRLDIDHLEAFSPSEYRTIIEEELFYPFDLTQSAIKASLLKDHEGKVALVLVFHHIIIDAWSLNVLSDEFTQIYKSKLTGIPSQMPKLTIQYKDYAVWQNTLHETGNFDNSRKYWINKFSDKIARLKLPIDLSAEETETYEGTNANFEFSNKISNQLLEFAKQNNVSLYMILIGALKSLLHRYTGEEDIIIGSVVSGRDHASLKEQVGFYVNTIALRTNIKGSNSFKQILEEVKTTTLDAFEHQSYPFDLLVNEIESETNAEKNPIFDVLISYHDSDESVDPSIKIADTVSLGEDIEFRNTIASKFDLSYTFQRKPDGKITGTLGFNANLFGKKKVTRMIHHFKNLLEEVINEPNEPIADIFYLEQQEVETLKEFNNTSKATGLTKGIKHSIEARAEIAPQSVAIITEKSEVTFEELNTKANRLSHYLKDTFNISKGDCVGVMMDNTVDRIVTLLSIIKLGAAYVPVDKENPFERTSFILNDTNARLLMTESFSKIVKEEAAYSISILKADDIIHNISEFSSENPDVNVGPEDIFSILYTSGSTGNPKGVLIKNEGLLNRINWFWNHYEFTEKDIIFQKTPFVFDVSIGEIFMPLCFGAKLVLATGEENSLQITESIIKYNLTYTHFSPTQLNNYLDAPNNDFAKITSLRRIVCSGEELTKTILSKYYKNLQIPLSNLYGPTEASIEVTYFDSFPDDGEKKRSRIPIGKPIDNVQIYVLDPKHKIVPVGFVGEIAIGGICLAEGYLNSPEKTKIQFIECNLSPGETTRVYKTGDLGMWLEDGTVQFLGRKDNQISINGSRIEPGEIESVISKHPKVHNVAVVPKKDEFNNWHLMAYYTLKSEESIEVEKKSSVVKDSRISKRQDFNYKDIASDKNNVYQLFQESFTKNADNTAIVFNDKSFSYRELRVAVDKLAAVLKTDYNAGVGSKIVLIAGRSEKTIVSILAIMKVRAVYIPIDSEYPEARINYILQDSAADLIITDQDDLQIENDHIPVLFYDTLNDSSKEYSWSEGEAAANLTDLCYICYTSGSTGKPKGVMIEQRSVIDYVETFSNYFELSEKDTVIQQSSISFDTSIEEIFPVLALGGKLIVLSEGGRDIEGIIKAINNHKVTVLTTTPLVINELNLTPERLAHMPRVIISGGDELRKSYIDKLIDKTAVFNTYGPTEFTVCSTFAQIDSIEKCNVIGKPINNHKIYLFDDDLKEIQTGEIGEMFIGGSGMARGYLNNMEETKRHFISHPAVEGLIYKTGDLAKYNENGELEFCGRKDSQVKIKGYRVEPIEIDNVLQKCSAVKNSVSVAKKDYNNDKHLVTYYKGADNVNEKEIISFLRNELPHYMVPDYLVSVAEFPLNSNGKIDVKLLPVPDSLLHNKLFYLELKDFMKKFLPAYLIPSQFVLMDKLPLTVSGKIDRKFLENKKIEKREDKKYIAPENEIEEKIQKVWEDNLKLSKISVDVNFFEIGGNSIKATQIMAMISKELGIYVPLKDIYNNPTILELARTITNNFTSESLLLKLNKVKADAPNVFFIPPVLGSSTIFKNLATDLNEEANAYGLQYRGFDKNEPFDESIKAMAKSFVQEIKATNVSNQPIVLVGYSMGATIGFEVAKILEEENTAVKLILVDRGAHEKEEILFDQKKSDEIIDNELAHWGKEIRKEDFDRIKQLVFHNIKILTSHQLEGSINSKIIAVEANKNSGKVKMADWQLYTKGDFEHHFMNTTHYEIINEQQDELVALIKKALA
ncbi:amino acid adenylation domain-containing protein [Flavobacterium cupreum]|uniref:Amino acid adenylation domain-containing protein n=3 Tax=Flavobacterium TaxID=237 RepID=A0A434A2T2_9FLAO|nr:non-ribosomal peptide synthetase [Flavobacterium cupreum]RUT68627.1 amino acid adenylation domain-containing protein [Flavobacterium cupreum]